MSLIDKADGVWYPLSGNGGARMDIYQRLKVKKYINAWDAVSAYGSSRMEKEK